MQIGNGLAPEEERTHFAMWCMMSTPLMIGCDLTEIPESTLDLLKNRELIALDQDPTCLQAYVVKEVKSDEGALLGEVWIKNLGAEFGCEKAVALLNRSDEPLAMTFRASETGLGGKVLALRDLWSHRDLAPTEELTLTIPPHGTAVLRVRGEQAGVAPDVNAHLAYREPEPIRPISREKARELIATGALLLDARTREEYARNHLKGALSTPFTEIYSHIWETVPTKDTPCVVYCSKGLRSAQVKYTMDHMGYTRVYLLGAVSPEDEEI